MKYTYLLIDLLSVLFPFLFSFHQKIRFSRYFSIYGAAMLITAIFFIIWDILFTQNGVWSFSSDYTMGINIFKLPVEEILFFFCIPFACTFTYFCFSQFYELKFKKSTIDFTVIVFSVILLYYGVHYADRLYTLVTFLSTSFLLLIFTFMERVKWMGTFILTYLILLLPFFIVNGLLTGTGLAAPVVLYNPHEMIGLRIFTIPLEDFVYGFELILLNVFLFEKFRVAGAKYTRPFYEKNYGADVKS